MQVHALDLMSKSVDGISVLHFALKKKKIVAVVRGYMELLVSSSEHKLSSFSERNGE